MSDPNIILRKKVKMLLDIDRQDNKTSARAASVGGVVWDVINSGDLGASEMVMASPSGGWMILSSAGSDYQHNKWFKNSSMATMAKGPISGGLLAEMCYACEMIYDFEEVVLSSKEAFDYVMNLTYPKTQRGFMVQEMQFHVRSLQSKDAAMLALREIMSQEEVTSFKKNE